MLVWLTPPPESRISQKKKVNGVLFLGTLNFRPPVERFLLCPRVFCNVCSIRIVHPVGYIQYVRPKELCDPRDFFVLVIDWNILDFALW